MASYNKTTKGSNRTVNHEGHPAFKMDDRTKLVSMALTTMLGEPKFYGDNTDELIRLAEGLCQSGDGAFVAKLAVWARTKGNLRSVSHALMAVVARHCSGRHFVRPAVRLIASQRGDDGTEMMATYLNLYGREPKAKHPNALRRGIRDAQQDMRAFSIAKYQSANRELKLRDVIRLTHPRPLDDEASEAMAKAIAGELPVPKSWETELSARGNTGEVWDELLSEGRVGFMAALRNMRNIAKSGADMTPVIGMLEDPERVRRSRQLPFRFYSAYRELLDANLLTTKTARALDSALASSCSNVEGLGGRTAILVDCSGSMTGTVSGRSKVSCGDIAKLLAAMLVHVCDDVWACEFNDYARVVPLVGTSILSDMGRFRRASGGTDMARGFESLIESGFDADRVIVLSDNEVNGGGSWIFRDNKAVIQSWLDRYRHKVGHDVWCHAIDLQGYGTQQFAGSKVNFIAGWSEQALRFVSMAEAGFGSLVDEIDSTEL